MVGSVFKLIVFMITNGPAPRVALSVAGLFGREAQFLLKKKRSDNSQSKLNPGQNIRKTRIAQNSTGSVTSQNRRLAG